MTLRIIRLWFAITGLIGLSLGCQSNDPVSKRPQYRIIKAAETAFNLELTVLYQYDSLGRLLVVKEYPSVDDSLTTVTPTAQTRVYYDATRPAYIGYVDRRLTRQVTDADGLVAGTRRTYNYDNQGRLSYVSESKSLNDFKKFKFTYAYQYEYTPDGLLGQLIVSGPAPLLERDIYTFTFINGNAVRINQVIITSRSPVPSVSESDVQFDTAPNIYYNYFAIYPGINSFNKNNVISASTTMFYDDRGLLIKRVRKGNYIDDVTIYTYETY